MVVHEFLGEGEGLVIYESVKYLVLVFIVSPLVVLVVALELVVGLIQFRPDSFLDELKVIFNVFSEGPIDVAVLARKKPNGHTYFLIAACKNSRVASGAFHFRRHPQYLIKNILYH